MKCKNVDCANLAKNNNLYCSLSCRSYYYNKYLRDYSRNGVGISKAKTKDSRESYLNSPKCCLCCGEVIPYEKRLSNKFCNSSCSSTYNNTGRLRKEETKQKIRELWANGHYATTSAISWKKAIKTNIKMFSSKNERMIVEYFKANFPDDKWKSGGGTKYKGIQISRDLYSDKLKVCVEYDGIWHFVDIKGQLENKKRKDSALQEWCLENGYRLIRVDEDAFAGIGQVVELVYNRIDKIIKIGNRYLP